MNLHYLPFICFFILCLLSAGCLSSGFDDTIRTNPENNGIPVADDINQTPAENNQTCQEMKINPDYKPYENILVKNLSVIPDMDSLRYGQNVTLKSEIILIPNANGDTIGTNNFIDLSTDLSKPRWNYDLVVNGVVNPCPMVVKNTFSISGWVLSYHESTVIIRIECTGTLPDKEEFVPGESVIISRIFLDKNDGYQRYDLVNVSTRLCHQK